MKSEFLRSRNRLAALALLISLVPLWARAQWTQQTIQLRPGWNAVYLEVHPEPEECDALFAGLPVESVWDFNRAVDLPQFVQDPTTLTPGSPGWLTWFPPDHPLASQSSLFVLRDGRPYLIKVASNAAPMNWTVTGHPSLRRTSWHPGGLNFAGFRVATPGPTFQNLFAGEPGLAGQPVYSLDASGVWRRVLDLATTRPRPGEAYWIRCLAPAQRAGTIIVEGVPRGGLLFGNGATEHVLRIRNTSSAARNISVRLLASAHPPVGQPPRAGPVPLEYWQSDFANTNFGWTPLPATLGYAALPTGQEWQIRFGTRLNALAPAPGAQYQSLLEITDDAGTRWLLPISAIPPGASGSFSAGPGLAAASAPAVPHAGLWVGEAVLKSVSQPAQPSDATTPRPAGGEFSFRLIIHVDAGGTARLLQRAYLVRKPPVMAPDPDNPGFHRIEAPARTLVLTDERLIPDLIGSIEVAGRRVSSAAFAFEDPLLLSGGAFGTGPLAGVVQLGYNDARNPFRHQFHPDHNNLDERFEQLLPEGKEAFTVNRTFSLEFSPTDPLGLNPPGWGDTELGGTYRENISGLHRSAIQVGGTFRLVRVASAAALNE